MFAYLFIAASANGQTTVNVTPTTMNAGGPLTVTWSGVQSPTSTDWFAVVPTGAADTQWVKWWYTTGAASGTQPQTLPSSIATGTYEIRLFAAGGWTRLAVSNTFTVQPPTVTVAPSTMNSGGLLTATWSGIQTPTAADWFAVVPTGAADAQWVQWWYTTGAASGTLPHALPSNIANGTYELRLFAAGSSTRLAVSNTFTVQPPVVSVTPSTMNAGGPLTATWSGIQAPTTTDWFAVVPLGAADTQWVKWWYTTGTASGSQPQTLPATIANGTYELRLFAAGGSTRLAVSNTFTVQSPLVSVTPMAAAAGWTVTATWSGIQAPTATDWLAVVPVGAADNQWVQWWYTTGTASGNQPHALLNNLASATYELRLFAANTTTRLAVSNSFTVAPISISGTITRASDGTAIGGALVELVQAGATVITATTNATGLYTMSGAAAGTYDVRASKAGYTTQTQSAVPVGGGAAVVNVALPSSGLVSYAYDALGRLNAVSDSGESARFIYDAVGNLLSIVRNSSSAVAIFGFSPASGPIGTAVTIAGTGFSATPPQNIVTFNGVAATIATASPTSLVATVPASAASGSIVVTSPSGSATSATPFAVTTSNTPTISSFAPTIATAGTSFTITGANFDPTAVNNRVYVNGHLATVTAASASSLTATIPTNTGSGRVEVATLVGSTVTAEDLFIPPSPYGATAVTFTGRTTLGDGKAVTLSVANKIALVTFDGVAGQRLGVQFTPGTLTSASITLLPPDNYFSGTAGSSDWYDVPGLATTATYTLLITSFSGTGTGTVTIYNVSDITGAIVPGGPSVPVSLTPGAVARYTFSGVAGQKVSLQAAANTFSAGALRIVKPDASALATASLNGSSVFIDTTILPVNGSYTVEVDPFGASAGSTTLTLYAASDLTGSIVPGGPAVPVSIAVPGQSGKYTFTSSSGQSVSLQYTGSTIGSGALSIQNAAGTSLGSVALAAGAGSISTLMLPAPASYTVLVDPSGPTTGSVTLTLSDPDVTGTIVPGGASVPIAITVPNQNARLTFSGAAGQRVSLSITGSTVSSTTLSILKSDGGTLGSTFMISGSGFVDTVTLPTAATYTVFVDPSSTATGNMTLTLHNVPADAAYTITSGGSSVTVTTTVPGQNVVLTFSGTANQGVYLKFSSGTYGANGAYVSMLKPDGSGLMAATFIGSSATLATQTLPVTGTYTIVVDPYSTATGSIVVKLSPAPAVLVNGTAPPATVTVAPSTTVTVTVSGGPANTTDWVALAVVGSANNATSVSWQYLSGTHTPPGSGLTSATLTFTMPSTAGNYEFRFFANDGYNRLATSTTVTVQ